MDERDKNSDLAKLADAFFENLQQDDFGHWGCTGKRPFGNSDVYGDILEIIEWKAEGDSDDDENYSDRQMKYAEWIYDRLGEYIKQQWKSRKV